MSLRPRGQREGAAHNLEKSALFAQDEALYMDWSERRHHLAGSLAAALWSRLHELGWAERQKNSRVVRFTAKGRRALENLF